MKKPHEKLHDKPYDSPHLSLCPVIIYATARSSFMPQPGLHLSLKNCRKASYFATGNT